MSELYRTLVKSGYTVSRSPDRVTMTMVRHRSRVMPGASVVVTDRGTHLHLSMESSLMAFEETATTTDAAMDILRRWRMVR